jgi:hypothetical protein
MKQLLIDIKAVLATITDIKHYAIFNNQIDAINKDDPNNYYAFPLPAVFVEFDNANQPQYIGNGVQIYEPLVIRFHILMEQLDSATGTLDENLDIFDLKNKVYLAFQNWHTEGSGTFNRTQENQDYNHNNLYVWQMEFTTSYIDQFAKEPRNGVEKAPPTNLDLTVTPNL